jgi:CheY-like chemotaxis protein
MSVSKPVALVVDDNIALARVTQFAFQRVGFDAVTAGNGRIALELARDRQFDVVVTDQQMPEMTGIELCRELRRLPEYRETPLMMLTAKGLEIELPQIRAELSIDAMFAKPFSPSEVVAKAQQLLDIVPA